MTHDEFHFNIYKTEFFGQYWKAKETKAVVVLVHGMGEHSTRYVHVAQKLTSNNYSVVAFDHFGHGKTEGKRGHNPNFEAVLESITKTIEKAKELFPNKPIFLYGHSMGGNAVLNYAIIKKHDLKGIIATSPFLKLAFKPPVIKLFVGKILQNIVPSLTMGNELDENAISRDKNQVEKYKNDSLVHKKISPNYSIKFIETGAWAIENSHKLIIPTLLLHGTDDSIIDYKGTQEFANNCKNATLKLYKGGYHELHNDLCKEEMLQDVIDWLNSQL
jgi:alpha-beta hydrolase superfamily lysophospholipase